LLIAKVIGDVEAGRSPAALEGRKLLLIQPLDAQEQPGGKPVLAGDVIGAGIGAHVFYVRGEVTSLPFSQDSMPVDAGIVGIIDYFNSKDGREAS